MTGKHSFATGWWLRLWLGAWLAVLAAPAIAADVTGVIRVVDGDTFDVGAIRVRLHGIDAPESDQTCARPDGTPWACGAWVNAQVAARYGGRQARCTAVDTDRYGRVVARCETAGADIGQALVSDGLAFAYRRYSMAYDLDEKGAAISGRGLHGSTLQRPADHRRATASPADAAPGHKASCRIKGNVSSKGARIFHSPGQKHYAATRISAARGERWFCTAAEARAAGWRPARR